jgi:hypothetical protein
MPASRRSGPLTFEDIKAAFAEFQDESDRAAAVLSLSLLDAQLEDILKAFSADDTAIAELVKPDHPLGSFGSRRRICLSLGLISADEAAELGILGKIRNEFAHNLHGLTFDTAPVDSWVQNLALPQRVFPRFRSFGRVRFSLSVGFVHLLLFCRLEAAQAAKRVAPAQAEIALNPMSRDEFERLSS